MIARVRAVTAVLVGCGAVAAIVAIAAPGSADSGVPYTDTSANGYVGLCDGKGHQVTNGSIDEDPFIVRATGSEPPPPDYRVNGEQATLYAFVPRKGVPPSQWSSEPLTGPTYYNDWHVPTAIGTGYDPPLRAVLDDIPPQWDGLYQLRLYYSAPDRPVPGGGYAATDLRISDGSWTVVRGGAVDCTSGSATPREALIPGLIASSSFVPTYINGRPNPKAKWPGGVVPTYSAPPFDDDPPTSAPRQSATPSGGGLVEPARPSAPASIARRPDQPTRLTTVAARTHAGRGLAAGAVVGLTVIGLAVMAAVAWFLRVRRSAAG